MCADGGRNKKLIVAFHFQFANQAAWRCDECRKQGLERNRRCPWLAPSGEGKRIVWARGTAVCHSCPKGALTGEALRWLEKFGVWKTAGNVDLMRLPARTAEAFFILDRELRAEHSDAR